MYKRYRVFNIFLLLLSLGFAQDVQYDFTAYGILPSDVDNKLFVRLNTAETKEFRCKYIDTIARIYLKSGNSDSLMHYGKLLKNETIHQDSSFKNIREEYLKSTYYIGVAAEKMGLLDEAIKSYIEGIEASNSSDFIQNYLKLQLANIYLSKGNLEKAKEILEKLPQQKTNIEFYLNNCIVKSRFLLLRKDYNQANVMINAALSEASIDEYLKLKLELELNLADIYLRQADYKNLILLSNSIKSRALNEGFYDVYIESSINEGYANAKLEQYDLAEMALSSAYVNTVQWNRLELQQRVIYALVQLYSAKKDYENAYALMTQYQNVSKTIAENQNQRLIKDIELKYETLKKEKEIDKLQEDQLLKLAEIDRQKTIKYAFLIGFIIILIPIVLLLIVYYQKLQTQSLLNQQQEAINQQEVKTLLQSQELELAKNAISVQAKERDRIARELHDSIGGNLAGIKLKINSIESDQPEFRQILNQLDTTYEQVREISHSLIPKEFESTALTDLIRNYIHNISKDVAINLRFETYANDSINSIKVELQVTLFNIIKELVTNALKHASATEITIQLTSHSDANTIELIYEDDGVGFDKNQVKKGIGLNNIETRVANSNGTLSINTAVNRGTVISISIPQK